MRYMKQLWECKKQLPKSNYFFGPLIYFLHLIKERKYLTCPCGFICKVLMVVIVQY